MQRYQTASPLSTSVVNRQVLTKHCRCFCTRGGGGIAGTAHATSYVQAGHVLRDTQMPQNLSLEEDTAEQGGFCRNRGENKTPHFFPPSLNNYSLIVGCVLGVVHGSQRHRGGATSGLCCSDPSRRPETVGAEAQSLPPAPGAWPHPDRWERAVSSEQRL